MPVSKSRRTKRPGQHPHAGRFAFSGISSQELAVRLMTRVFLLCVVLVLGASTISDPVQAVVKSGIDETLAATQGVSPDETLKMRAALLRHTVAQPDAVRDLSRKELLVVFGQPTLMRQEGKVTAWQFASGECALDIYFREQRIKPVYAEYRVRGSAEGKAVKARLDHRSCLKSLFVKVPPL